MTPRTVGKGQCVRYRPPGRFSLRHLVSTFMKERGGKGVVIFPAVLAVLICLTGCELSDRQRELALERQCDVAEEKVRQLTEEVEKLSGDLKHREEQIETLQKLGEKRLENLFSVEEIKLGRHSGGIDLDKKPGQDAIKVFLLPRDKSGCVLKVAGDVKIQLFDLAQPKDKTLLDEFFFPVKDIGEHWSGSFMTYHYSFVCQWKTPPEHDEITIRATFTDYLTGKTFTAQKLCKIKLPPPKAGK